MLYFETRRHAIRIEDAATVFTAAGADTTENAGVAVTGRTLQPIGSSTCCVMFVLYFTIPGRVIAVLFKVIGLL